MVFCWFCQDECEEVSVIVWHAGWMHCCFVLLLLYCAMLYLLGVCRVFSLSVMLRAA